MSDSQTLKTTRVSLLSYYTACMYTVDMHAICHSNKTTKITKNINKINYKL